LKLRTKSEQKGKVFTKLSFSLWFQYNQCIVLFGYHHECSIKFALDHSAPEDVSFPATVENVIREFAKTQLAREQDAYRIHRLYTLASQGEHAGTHVMTVDPEGDDMVEKLCTLAQNLEDASQRTGGLVAMVAANLKNRFLQAAAGNYNTVTFDQQVDINGITYSHVMMVNDLPCIFVPSGRMKTAIAVQSGRDGQTAGGIQAGEGAKDIYAVIAACDAPLAISKVDSLKQFGPEENQLFDGTAIQARYLYDLVVPEDKLVGIGALVQG